MTSPELNDPKALTKKIDQSYMRTASIYDWLQNSLPFYRRLISNVIPYIVGLDV